MLTNVISSSPDFIAGFQDGFDVLVKPSSLQAYVIAPAPTGIASVDTANIQNAINSLASGGTDPDGGTVFLQKGLYLINAQLIVKNKVRLVGAGRSGTIVRATASFPAGTALINIGTASVNSFYSRVESMTIDAQSVTGSMCCYTNSAQEKSGVIDCVLSGYMDSGYKIDGGSGQNQIFRDVECYPGASASAIGLNITSNAGATLVCAADNTFVGNSGTPASAGIFCNAGLLACGPAHFEYHTDGILLGSCGAEMTGLNGPTSGNTVTNLVHANGGTRYYRVGPSIAQGATRFIRDDINGYQGPVGFGNLVEFCDLPSQYAGLEHIPSGFPYAATVAPDPSRYVYNYMTSAITGAMSVTVPTAVRGRMLIVELLQDGAGAHVVTWPSGFKGVTLAASGGANTTSITVFMSNGTNWYQLCTSGWN